MARRVSPDIPVLLQYLRNHRVDFVLAGSVAVQSWGVDVGTPSDLDIVPDMSRQNLSRLAGMLRHINAQSWPITGRWATDASGEARWESYAEDHPLYGTRISDPDPDDPSTFDSLFSTDHGELDIVPVISGRYEEVVRRAHRLTVHGLPDIAVMSPGDLLACLAIPRRAKDAARVRELRAVQHRRNTP